MEEKDHSRSCSYEQFYHSYYEHSTQLLLKSPNFYQLVHNRDNKSCFKIPGYCFEERGVISYKIKKIACKAIKGKGVQSGFRIIFVYQPREKIVTFVEFYHKKDKKNNDYNRLSDFIKSLTKETQ